jgi:hypothetical protein
MRGIGSLMRGRNVFSLIQALREGYELLPEEYQVLDEALQYLKGTEFNPFGMDKPGIESFKELLGISPEDLGETPSETIPLPGPEPSFEKWFKNSKVVNKKGEPLIVYHGTPYNFGIFKRKKGRPQGGFFFTQSPRLASNMSISESPEEGANVMATYLSLQNPLVVKEGSPEADEVTGSMDDTFRKELEKKGYDGIIVQRIRDVSGAGPGDKAGDFSEIVVFDEKNIKSSISNLGAYDPTNPIITKAAGGFIDKPLYDDRRMIG